MRGDRSDTLDSKMGWSTLQNESKSGCKRDQSFQNHTCLQQVLHSQRRQPEMR
jgi:hypothetical protein